MSDLIPQNEGSHTIATTTDPAAGADVTIQVPTHERWRLHSVAFTLTASAVVATRLARIEIYSGLTLVESYGCTLGQVATDTWKYFAAEGLGYAVANFYPHVGFGLPTKLILPPESILNITAAQMDVGDQFTNAFIVYESWVNA